jgi:hypothetical protein
LLGPDEMGCSFAGARTEKRRVSIAHAGLIAFGSESTKRIVPDWLQQSISGDALGA